MKFLITKTCPQKGHQNGASTHCAYLCLLRKKTCVVKGLLALQTIHLLQILAWTETSWRFAFGGNSGCNLFRVEFIHTKFCRKTALESSAYLQHPYHHVRTFLLSQSQHGITASFWNVSNDWHVPPLDSALAFGTDDNCDLLLPMEFSM